MGSESIHQIAFRHGIDRRRHPRVNFPKDFSCFSLPTFRYLDRQFEILDLSQGGVCLFDPQNEFTLPVGTTGEMTWIYEGYEETLRLQLVGISYQKKHLEFKNISEKLTADIQSFIQSGIWGQKMQRSILSPQAHLETMVMELWVGIGGANLSFHADPHFLASVDTPHFNVHFYKGSLPVCGRSTSSYKKGEILNVNERVKLLFFLVNFPVLSSRLVNLLGDWAALEQSIEEKAG